ncbi:hypothetical protein SAMN05518672_10169 [Chitinophaga sp. CF118]|nr:hypothetical protein SAMN05518672_10169 [Chitinophaga sp. CF118]
MVHTLGIRHHGPGSARNVKAFLEATKPDIVLVEGPPEADAILQWSNHTELKPPVAILIYQSDNLQHSVFYPFAEFSPEWQAIQYAYEHHIPVRFMDMPVAHVFALRQEETVHEHQENPVGWLAEAAGYTNTDKWWEQMFEHRTGNEQVFEAVSEAMHTVREMAPPDKDPNEPLREAWMRKIIRQAQKEMYTEIAVICGAWHVPALTTMPSQKEDNDLLKGLPKVKTECTWIPWTYDRLSFYSGYGAGIHSPGWYEHIWQFPHDDGTQWMAKVARLFREKQMDTSVAHIIEAVRLAQSLAALRERHRPGLEELNEATLSVLCNGESVLMKLIHDELIVSNKIGGVPFDIPKPPLQADIERLQKKLRLPTTADWKDYVLDLRKENDLERSIFLHRLQLLDLNWAEKVDVSGKGTFKEQWRLQWDPAFIIDIIDKGVWGNTVETAAAAYVKHMATSASSLQVLCTLLENALPAELPQAAAVLIQQVSNLSAATGDVIQLMEVIPPLVSISRYGNVRKTDAELVTDIAVGMITRICISLPGACTGIADEAAQTLLQLFLQMNNTVNILQQPDITSQWQQTLHKIAASNSTSPILAGYSTRLLADYKLFSSEQLVQAFYSAMSAAILPNIAAAWLEGFLKGSGTLLLIDADLWRVVNDWVHQLDENNFIQVLPLLRRTFAGFSTPERRKLGEKVKHGDSKTPTSQPENIIADERAAKGLPVIMQLLGYKNTDV